ncbi:MAG TPA: hypothetical protein VLI90_20895, partial [Tepidisphaeraceae bacterium]|nr:hypothetical protein [Tepidisphaeraceae bacterium]
RAARRHAGDHAHLATFLAAITLLNFGWATYTGFQLETIQCFFTCLAAAAALEVIGGGIATTGSLLADAFVAGLAAGSAAMVKPTALAVGGGLGLALLLQVHSRGWRTVMACMAAVIAGVAVPTLAVAYWVWKTGIAGEMPNLFRQIAWYGSKSPMDSFTVTKLFIAGVMCAQPLVVRGWVFRRDVVPVERRIGPSQAMFAFVIAWFALELAGIIMQGRMYLYHFLPLAPPLALLYGVLPRTARAPVIGLGLIPIALMSMHWPGSKLVRANEGTQHKAISQYLIDHTKPGDAVFADQAGRILLETGLRPGSRYGIFYYWVNYDNAPQDYCSRMLADFDERKPKYIVLAYDADDAMAEMLTGPILGLRPVRSRNTYLAWRQFKQYLSAHYQFETRVDDNDLYRIRQEPSATARIESGDAP